jgi:arginyl-tRNA--protein-N-Asp/Glu arginylyltransferase
MSQLNDIPLTTLHFYMTAPYPCSYLPDLQARSQVASPSMLITAGVYSELVQHGFRRSGTYTYLPRCDTCQACVPLRVLAKSFTPTRSQRRTLSKHGELQISLHELQDKLEYFQLYQRYQTARHKDGGMDNDDHESYRNFLLQSHVDTLLVEFREQGILRMVSVIDVLADGLSSVYTFFEPDLPHSSFGIYNVLWQIDLCRELGLEHVYLGYWIEDSRKMSYKTRYQPAEGLINGVWQPLTSGAQL